MNTADLYISLRYKLPEEEYSPYQIVDALNYVINEISIALNSVTSSLITTSASVTLTLNEGSLPSDLETIINVGGTGEDQKLQYPIQDELDAYSYQIVGSKIKCQGTTVTIYYRKNLPSYSYVSKAISPTTIDLPVSFNNMIKDNIISYLTGQPANIQLQTIKLIANRDGKKRPQRFVFNL
jgi:hypothetical protein